MNDTIHLRLTALVGGVAMLTLGLPLAADNSLHGAILVVVGCFVLLNIGANLLGFT